MHINSVLLCGSRYYKGCLIKRPVAQLPDKAMRINTVFIGLLFLLSGCMVGTEGFPLVDIRGHMDNASTDSSTQKIYIYYCDGYSYDYVCDGCGRPHGVTLDSNGDFDYQMRYIHGGVMMFIPPLGGFPRITPPPPDICISFPDAPGQYYEIKAGRDEVSWEEKSEASDKIKEKTILPTIKKVTLEEMDLRGGGSINDWLLHLELEDVGER